MTVVTATFDLPPKIVAGIAEGIYERVGGIVREVSGRKEIVVWLKEVNSSVLSESGAGLDSRVLSDALRGMQGAIQLANGLGALNLAVSTAGFAMIRQQLNGIVQQIGNLSVDVRAIQKETTFINGLALAGIRADVDSALEHADRAQRTNNKTLHHDAKIALVGIRNRLLQAVEFIFECQLSLEKHALLGELLKAGAIVAVGEALCDEALEGPDAAVQTLERACKRLRALTSRFDEQRREFKSDPITMLSLSTAGRHSIAELHSKLVETGDQLESAAEIARLRSELGLDADGWKKLVPLEGSGAVVVLLRRTELG